MDDSIFPFFLTEEQNLICQYLQQFLTILTMNQKSSEIQSGKIECISCKELKLVERLIQGKCFACCYNQHKQHIETKISKMKQFQMPLVQKFVTFNADYKSSQHQPLSYQRQQQFKIENTLTPKSITKKKKQLNKQTEYFYYKQIYNTPKQDTKLERFPLYDKYNHQQKPYEKQIPQKQNITRFSSKPNIPNPRQKMNIQYNDNLMMNKFNQYQKQRKSLIQPLFPEKKYIPYDKSYKVEPIPILRLKDKSSYDRDQKYLPKSNREYLKYQVRNESRNPPNILSFNEQMKIEISKLRSELAELKALKSTRTLFRYCGMCGRQDKLFNGICKKCL